MNRYAPLLVLALAACAPMAPDVAPRDSDAPTDAAPVIRPPAGARTAAQFDTTSEAERRAAQSAESTAGTALGTSIASLGNPARPGFWLETPLVSSPAKGRVEYPVNGKWVAVDLIPIDGPASGGSRISLAAMRLLEAPLTGLPQVRVFAQ